MLKPTLDFLSRQASPNIHYIHAKLNLMFHSLCDVALSSVRFRITHPVKMLHDWMNKIPSLISCVYSEHSETRFLPESQDVVGIDSGLQKPQELHTSLPL